MHSLNSIQPLTFKFHMYNPHIQFLFDVMVDFVGFVKLKGHITF